MERFSKINNLFYIRFVFWFSLQRLCETFLVVRGTEGEMIQKMYIPMHRKYRYSCHILMKLEFSRQILKNSQTSSFMKIHKTGAELFHAGGRTDRRTDMTKLTVSFRNFANGPKNPVRISQRTLSPCTYSIWRFIYSHI